MAHGSQHRIEAIRVELSVYPVEVPVLKTNEVVDYGDVCDRGLIGILDRPAQFTVPIVTLLVGELLALADDP